MRRSTRSFMLGALTCAILLPALPAHARWEGRVVAQDSLKYPNTPIPDPTGIAFNPKQGTFFIADAEVDETPSLWHNRNLFIVGRGGNLKAARRLKMTTEPEGIAWWGAKSTLFVVDDDQDLILSYRKGRDGAIGTGDDKVRKLINTRRWGSLDPEGLTFTSKGAMLIWVDASDQKVYKLRRGNDLRFGTADDKIAKFGTEKFGFTEAESVAVNPKSNHLFIVNSNVNEIVETTFKGALVKKIFIPSSECPPACNLTGLVFAPGTDGAPRRLYLTDKGVDGDFNPDPAQVNDGQLYQMRLVNQ
jgi:DNA-binding beta-propeller fold protein YncE